jgi:hypothetical protein
MEFEASCTCCTFTYFGCCHHLSGAILQLSYLQLSRGETLRRTAIVELEKARRRMLLALVVCVGLLYVLTNIETIFASTSLDDTGVIDNAPTDHSGEIWSRSRPALEPSEARRRQNRLTDTESPRHLWERLNFSNSGQWIKSRLHCTAESQGCGNMLIE